HPSPYLALHGGDPVAWQDWGPEVLERAKRENKLILLSSGYFSCHWCHVMQRESYKNSEVAEMLNNFFIPVKIDRELEPALDKRLMAYAQATLKRGGWPLNVFMSPDGLPVFAVLYQPQLQFLGLLTRLTGVWEQQSEHIRELALAEKTPLSFPDSDPELDSSLITELRALAVQGIMARGDELQGGFGQSNKFPSVPQLNFLLDSLAGSPNPEVIEFLDLTLSSMADNGMQDHLNGGFYRYVVDPAWEIPHFEKMLYDNADLAQLYLKAGQVLNDRRYTDIARTTLDFLIREMANKEGILYASFSAVDDKDVEGGYYLWQTDQLKTLLNDHEYRVFSEVWETERPNDLEEGNHLRAAKPVVQAAATLQLSETEILSLLSSARQKLITERNTRILPTDDKLLAGWNALSLSAFAIAAKTLDEENYRTQAGKIKTFIMQRLWIDNQLKRSLARGQLVGSASIEDYAYVARGLFDWAQLTDEAKDYQQAEMVLVQGWKRFYKNNVWSYADTSVLPPAEGEEMLSEGSSASPSATLIKTTIALHKAGKLNDPTLYNTALSALNRGKAQLRRNPFWYVSQIAAMQLVKQ
ncbi:MAG: thioredoxin domain-containing protein, partial [Proteobacteria bacterium]|nr:thioredoxin domain-containing protein [Pseudomonadota bacterium]